MFAVAGTKGAPGATTLCLGLARCWRAARPVLLVEADPEGGCLAGRLGLSEEPGLATLAAAGRHELSPRVLEGQLQSAPDGVALIVAPSSPALARAALRTAADGLAAALAGLRDTPVVVDLGRLEAQSPAVPLAGGAEQVIFTTRPTLEGADALAVRLAELGELRRRCRLVTVGDGPYGGDEIAQVLAVEHLGHLPHDPAGATSLWSATDKSLRRRHLLLGALAQIAGRLVPTSPRAVSEPDDDLVVGARAADIAHLTRGATR